MNVILIDVGLFLFYVAFTILVLVVDIRFMMRRARRNTKVIPFRASRWIQGFSLLELLIVCAIIIIITSIALPNASAMIRAWNNKQAYQRVSTVNNATAALAICNAAHQSCPGVAPLIPQPGTMRTTTYTFIYAYTGWEGGSWWSYVAIPNDHAGRSFFVDATGIVRYCDNCSQAGNTSPVYQ